MGASNNTPTTDVPRSSADIMRQFLPASPYVRHLGLRLTDLQPGVATLTLTLPFTAPLATIGTTVHGGAIASLIDTAAMEAPASTKRQPNRGKGLAHDPFDGVSARAPRAFHRPCTIILRARQDDPCFGSSR